MYRSDAIDDVVKTADAVPGVGGLEENTTARTGIDRGLGSCGGGVRSSPRDLNIEERR
jgi:hypothetical protein